MPLKKTLLFFFTKFYVPHKIKKGLRQKTSHKIDPNFFSIKNRKKVLFLRRFFNFSLSGALSDDLIHFIKTKTSIKKKQIKFF